MPVKRKTIHLECSGCRCRNYRYQRSATATKGRLQIKKFCKHCQKHTLHVQAK